MTVVAAAIMAQMMSLLKKKKKQDYDMHPKKNSNFLRSLPTAIIIALLVVFLVDLIRTKILLLLGGAHLLETLVQRHR